MSESDRLVRECQEVWRVVEDAERAVRDAEALLRAAHETRDSARRKYSKAHDALMAHVHGGKR